MNYYPFHLGDYAAHTAHLEPMEDLAYRRMLDLYYLREGALPQEPAEVARLIRMRSHVAEVEAMLREFFTNNDGDGWIHARCEAELSRMQDKQAKAKASAQASVNARLARQESERSTNVERTLNERSTDGELPTPTPTPTPEEKTKTARKRAAPAVLVSLPELVADGVDEQHATDWLVARKSKGLPLTPTAWADIKAEAIKANLTPGQAIKAAAGNGWAGFKAAWLHEQGRAGPTPSAHERKAAEMAKWMNPQASRTNFDFIDMEPSDAAPLALR